MAHPHALLVVCVEHGDDLGLTERLQLHDVEPACRSTQSRPQLLSKNGSCRVIKTGVDSDLCTVRTRSAAETSSCSITSATAKYRAWLFEKHRGPCAGLGCAPGCPSGVKRGAIRVQELAGRRGDVRPAQTAARTARADTAAALLRPDEARISGDGLPCVPLAYLITFNADCAPMRPEHAHYLMTQSCTRGWMLCRSLTCARQPRQTWGATAWLEASVGQRRLVDRDSQQC